MSKLETSTETRSPAFQAYMDYYWADIVPTLATPPAAAADTISCACVEEDGMCASFASLVSLINSIFASCIAFFQSFWTETNPEVTQVMAFVAAWRQPAAADETALETWLHWTQGFDALPLKARIAAINAFGQNRNTISLLSVTTLNQIEGECSSIAADVQKMALAHLVTDPQCIEQLKAHFSAQEAGIRQVEGSMRGRIDTLRQIAAQHPEWATDPEKSAQMQHVEQTQQELDAKMAEQAEEQATLEQIWSDMDRFKQKALSFGSTPDASAQGQLRQYRRFLQAKSAIADAPRDEVVLNALEAWSQTQQQG